MEYLLSLMVALTSSVAAAQPRSEARGGDSDSPRPSVAQDFETQVIPVLTKAGCNSGSCHGAAVGRGGFRLSLLGYDPRADFDSIVNEFEGRRINLAHPEKSLVLRKPTLDVGHEGGLRLDPAGDGFQVLYDWIVAGVPHTQRRSLERIDVSPKARWLQKPGDGFSIQVTAQFRDDGRVAVEDVTRWCVITATDAAATRIGPQGEVTALRRGQSTVMVRFLGEVASVLVTVPIGEQSDGDTERPRTNFVDDHVNRTLDELRLPHSPRTDDTSFVRRVFLDLIGTLPTPAEVDDFAADNAVDKRSRLVQSLLQRSEFVDYWSYKWGDLLRIESRRLQPEGAAAFHQWVRTQVEQNTPLDEMARAMLLASGDAHRYGPANFHRVPNDARAEAEQVSRVFLGVRLQCANCHNHPLDRWTQDDYHGLAAVFARIDRGRDVKQLPRGEVIHPKTGAPAPTKIPGAQVLVPSSALDAKSPTPVEQDPRIAIADWLTGPDNAFFARAAVNRVWRELMGRGLVEPIDDHRATNPATHPELLDALASDFVDHAFDVQHTIRTIVASEAYQRTSRATPGNEQDDRFYSRAITRPLAPPVLVDAVAKVTGVPESLGDRHPGTTAISLGDSRVASQPLDLLGRCSRDGDCEATPNVSGSLPLTLHTINGMWLNAKIEHPEGRLSQLLLSGASVDEIVSECYRLALCRAPRHDERAYWKRVIEAGNRPESRQFVQDFMWALLNSAEFCTNH